MKSLKTTHLLLVVLFSLLLAACGGSAGPTSNTSPEEVVEGAYQAIIDQDFELFKKHITEEAETQMEGGAGALAGGPEGAMNYWSRGGTLESVETEDAFYRGTIAVVTTHKHFENGSVQTIDIYLEKENDVWQISWNTPTL